MPYPHKCYKLIVKCYCCLIFTSRLLQTQNRYHNGETWSDEDSNNDDSDDTEEDSYEDTDADSDNQSTDDGKYHQYGIKLYNCKAHILQLEILSIQPIPSPLLVDIIYIRCLEMHIHVYLHNGKYCIYVV